ncbi:MAG: hypothetical protein LKJ69_01790 [Lactobacillus sp.]|jgi:hypothetical protein|nr:hypothetical protein [Lactobacillus sp.]MCI2032116.1 hypothetical protein [Lactobacillus sp.]
MSKTKGKRTHREKHPSYEISVMVPEGEDPTPYIEARLAQTVDELVQAALSTPSVDVHPLSAPMQEDVVAGDEPEADAVDDGTEFDAEVAAASAADEATSEDERDESEDNDDWIEDQWWAYGDDWYGDDDQD